MMNTRNKRWKRWTAFALSIALMLTMLPNFSLGAVVLAAETEEDTGGGEVIPDGNNVALKATAGADYSNTGTSPANVNNGYLAAEAKTTWNTWKKEGASYPAPIWLEWKVSHELTGMRVVWWADSADISGSDSVTFPKSCTVEYQDANGSWQKITGMTNEQKQTVDGVGVLFNSSDGNGLNGANQQWNTVVFPQKVKTKKLRLLVERSGTGKNGVGISEWEVYGNVSADAEKINIADEATAEAAYSNNSTSATNVNDGQLAGDSKTTWNTWCNAANLEYPYPIVLKWKKQRTLSSMKVMWWADDAEPGTSSGDGVLFPKDCKVQYWDKKTNAWTDIKDMTDENGKKTDSVGVKCGSETVSPDDAQAASKCLKGNNRYWNEVKFATDIMTDQIRLLVDKPDRADKKSGIGIGEWEVYGNYQDDPIVNGANIAPKAKASAEYANTDTSVDKVNDMELAGDSKTTWNTWKNEGDLKYPQPVTLTWEEPYDISGMRVMWWADDTEAGTANGDGVLFPAACEAWYWDYGTGDWKKITAMENENGEEVSTVGVKQNGTQGNNRTWNGAAFTEPVKTCALQLRIARPANAQAKGGIGIGEWEVYGTQVKDEFVGAKITGKKQLLKSETSVYYAQSIPNGVDGEFSYEWSVPDGSKDKIQIVGDSTGKSVSIKALSQGAAVISLKMSAGDIIRQAQYEVGIDEITSVDDYVTSTTPGKAPILPDTVVANGIAFDDPTPSLKSSTKDYDFGEEFNSKLMPVTWNEIEASAYDTAGKTFEVEGTVANSEIKAKAKVTVKEAAEMAGSNSTVTFENVEVTDEFWLPKQKVNALNSLNAAIYRISLASGGEPNFDNAIKKLNGEPYEAFNGLVFQDTDIYKTLEAISYTLSVFKDEKKDAEIIAQKKNLEEVLERWISKIEQVQYADGYINTHFTLRSQKYEGGRAAGTHRWRNMNNHEMYIAGHFLESVVAYTRYREGIGEPDYRLYVAGRRFADHIVARFGPNGTRHEVPGHEEIELALVKFAKLAEEYEGEGAGDKYVQTAKLLIDRRGEDYKLRESGYQGYTNGKREYSQDSKPFTQETNAVGHAVRATYLYTGATDVARLLPEDDPDKEAYLNILDTIWDSVANRKTYITGGIGVASHGEDFGGDYELPNDDSYNEICASIALTNWNQRMNLVHEDAKYADVMERALYNGILVGTNLEGNKFYYANKLEIPKKGGSTDGGMYGGVQRQDWFTCACCPPNLMRTIAKLSEYMYTIHGDKVYVNLYVGSNGNLNVDGTNVNIVQDTEYPWKGTVGIAVTPAQAKVFTMNVRIPGWVKEQDNRNVTIKVVNKTENTTENIKAADDKGYIAITREWKAGDVIEINMPMEVRKTEADPQVTTNKDKVAIERGPIVYALEKAGNAQLNSAGISESSFDPRNFLIPRDSELTAAYRPDLLKGTMEITGNVKYKKSDTETIDAKLQAVPFYASNNRGDSNEYQPNGKSTRMTVWTNASGEQAVKHTVTLDANGGTVSQATMSIKDGMTIGSLPMPVRSYHRFLGWYTEKDGGEEVTEDTVVSGDMRIYAHWEADTSVTFHTVTFDPMGGKGAKESIDVEEGKTVGALSTPTKTGSVFLGWYTEKDGGKEVTKDTVVNGDMIVYARWQDLDVVFGASGSQSETDAYLIAMNGSTSAEGNSASAAYIKDETATGGLALASSRVGCMAFKLSDAWKAMDPEKISATVTIEVKSVNGNLGDAKTRAGLYAVDQDLADITLTDASTYPAKNADYSKAATAFSKEWISKTELGKKTFDVTALVKEILKNKNATHAIFRLQTVTSGFSVINSGENAPALSIIEKANPPQKTDQEAADEVINLINSLGKVTLEDKEKIEEARRAYDGLTEEQKKLVGLDVLKVLTDAEKEYKKQEEEKDKIPGRLTITCAGFTYDGTRKPSPKVSETTNGGAEIIYRYYADAALEQEIDVPLNAGTYYVKGFVDATDKYKGTESEAVKFVIVPKKVEKASVSGITAMYYTGKALTQKNLKVAGYKKGTDYTVSYKNNTKVGKATVTITFRGNYTGKITKEFTIKKAIPKKNKTYKVGDYTYKVTKAAAKNGTVELKAPKKKTLKSVTVPSTVKISGYTFKVTEIGKNAFKNNKKLEKVTIGANVTKIGANAFSGCKKLKKIMVKTKKLNKKSVGKNALKNIYKKAVIRVPKGKNKAYKKVFKGKGQKKTVKIK